MARTVVVEHHPELDALVMSGTDGALMVSTIVPLGDDLASPEWGEVRESAPASTTVVWDPDASGWCWRGLSRRTRKPTRIFASG